MVAKVNYVSLQLSMSELPEIMLKNLEPQPKLPWTAIPTASDAQGWTLSYVEHARQKKVAPDPP